MASLDPRREGAAALAVASALLLTAVVLYLSALSRAVGVVLTGVAATVFALGLSTRVRGRRPSRGVLVVVALAAVALLGVGVWTWVIASMAENCTGLGCRRPET